MTKGQAVVTVTNRVVLGSETLGEMREGESREIAQSLNKPFKRGKTE
jgi:hypothetical protein